MDKRHFQGLACAIAFSILGSPLAFGQAIAVASVSGTVTDQTGSVVPGAAVTISETETGQKKTATTDTTGHYAFPDLPVGPYQLEVKAHGFKAYVQKGIVLQVGTNVTSNVALQLGAVSQTVEVSAAANMVETQNSAVSQVINTNSVNDLPLNARQVTQLVLLSGAAVQKNIGDLAGSKTFHSSTTISVAGGQSNGTNYMLDGGYYVDTFTNLNMPYPFPDAVQEFSVQTSALPAQYGEHPGGIMNAVTKSGTNQFHGDLFDYLRNGDLDARNYFGTTHDSLRRNQYGGTIGGPIIHNKLFFFAGYQGTPTRTSPPQSTSYVPTDAVIHGDFSTIEGPSCTSKHKFIQLSNPFTGADFAGDQIPTTMFDPSAVKMLQYLPAATNACGKVVYGIPQNSDEYQPIGRVDWNINSKQTFFARYFLDDYEFPADFDPKNALVTTKAGNSERAQSITLGDTYTFSATTLNSAHFTFDRRRDNRGPAAQGISPKDIDSNVFSQDPNFLRVTVSDYFSTYCGTCNTAFFNTNTWSYADDMTLVRGKHQIMFGANVIRTQFNGNNHYDLDGIYGFGNELSGSDLADFMLGDLSSYGQSLSQLTANRQTNIGLYIQDTYRAARNFTVSAGLRWEPMFFPQDYFGRGSSFNTSDFLNNVHSKVYPNAPAGMLYYGDAGIPKAFAHDDLNVWSPRLGLVFSPGKSGHDTFRVGGGILYDTTEMFFDERVQSNPPFVDEIDESFGLNDQGVLSTGPNGYGTMSQPWITYPGGNPFPPAGAFFPTSSALYVIMPLHIKPTAVYQWDASYQHQFGADWLASFSYMGNTTRHIWVGRETNPAIYIPGSSASTQDRRVLTLLNPTQGLPIGSLPIADDGANSNYNGLLISLQHRFAHNYTLLVNYTYSHCLSEADFRGEVTSQVFENPYNLRQDYSSCDFDDRHIFNTSFVGTTPHWGGKLWGKIVGNWQFAPIIEVRSGLPFTITSGKDNSKTDVGNDRPDQVAAQAYTTTLGPDVPQYLIPGAFTENTIGTFGSVGRNSVYAPGSFEFDAALSRIFSITERWRLEARVEAFNLINHTNLGTPSSKLSSSHFGQITSAGDPRILQLALKLFF